MQVFFSIHRNHASTEVAGVRYLSVTFESTKYLGTQSTISLRCSLHTVVLHNNLRFPLLSVKTMQFLAIRPAYLIVLST